MHITLFGATGRTGQILLSGTLEAGHTVTALVRDPVRVGLESAELTVMQGSILDPEAVEQAISGAKAVISVLGPTQNKPVFEISSATSIILSAMRHCGVRRFVMTAGAGVRDPSDAPGAIDRFMGVMLQLTAGNIYEDMRRSVDIVRATDTDWTIVRVPVLTNAARSGRIRAGYVGKGTGSRLSRYDLADFLLKQLTDNTYVHQTVMISN